MKSLRNKIILTAEFDISINKDVQDVVEDEIYRKIPCHIRWIIVKELENDPNKR